jgi:hypothetical protein
MKAANSQYGRSGKLLLWLSGILASGLSLAGLHGFVRVLHFIFVSHLLRRLSLLPPSSLGDWPVPWPWGVLYYSIWLLPVGLFLGSLWRDRRILRRGPGLICLLLNLLLLISPFATYWMFIRMIQSLPP